MFMDYILRTAEAVADEKDRTVSLEEILKSKPAKEYAQKLGIENRLENVLKKM